MNYVVTCRHLSFKTQTSHTSPSLPLRNAVACLNSLSAHGAPENSRSCLLDFACSINSELTLTCQILGQNPVQPSAQVSAQTFPWAPEGQLQLSRSTRLLRPRHRPHPSPIVRRPVSCRPGCGSAAPGQSLRCSRYEAERCARAKAP